MLQKEYNHLLKCCKKLQSASKGIRYTLDTLLSEKSRSFSVYFDGVKYDFFPATTYEEVEDQAELRNVFIKNLLLKSYEDMLSDDNWDIMESINFWDNILIFAMGNPIEYYQIENIKEENILDVTDSKEKIQDGVALNEESVYVQWQDENKVKFEETK